MADAGNGTVLSSDWGGLNPNLIASFWPVRRVIGDNNAYRWERVPGASTVQAPITDATVDHTINWNSPFENTGVDQNFSSMSGLLQSGAFAPLLAMFNQFLAEKGASSEAAQATQNKLSDLAGRSSVTKLNSTQIFNGSHPMKLTLTAHFRAISDPLTEVQQPENQLIQWGLPRKLAQDGPIMGLLKDGDPALFPSEVPNYLAMQYAGMLFMPMVMEGMPYALTGQRDALGRKISSQINLTLGSLTSIDADDWKNIFIR